MKHRFNVISVKALQDFAVGTDKFIWKSNGSRMAKAINSKKEE
jgi:hypothetical protein